MTIGDFITTATQELVAAGIGSPRLDVLLLLEDALNEDRAHILAHPELKLTNPITKKLELQIKRRKKHTPLAYIRGRTLFYGRTFQVNAAVLVPRPESEAIITLLKEAFAHRNTPLHLADIGTGSGSLGITAALELQRVAVDLYDVDALALACAQDNAKIHGVQASFYRENLLTHAFTPQRPHYDAVLANLPYVPNSYHINDAAKHEPKIALFGGDNGLDLYRRFWGTLTSQPKKPAYIITESLIEQHAAMIAMAEHAGYILEKTTLLVQRFRNQT